MCTYSIYTAKQSGAYDIHTCKSAFWGRALELIAVGQTCSISCESNDLKLCGRESS